MKTALPSILAALLSTAAFGHAHLTSPTPRNTAANKTGPCGAVRTATPATFTPGQVVTVNWTETVNHPGHYRIAFSPAGDQGFDQNILKDNIPNPAGAQTTNTTTVTLPTTPCTDCTLQLIQVMTDTTPASNYYSCADIVISGGTTGTGTPTVATAAASLPASVNTGTSAALSVLGADDKGETALTYTWMAMVAPGAVTFSVNGTNAAKQTTATFGAAGAYTFQVSIADADMKVITSTLNVTVAAVLTQISVSPASAMVAPSGTVSFTSAALDQFGLPFATAPAVTWTVSGGGAVSSAGVFTAGSVTGGPFDLTATSGSLSAKAAVTVSAAPMDQTPPVVSISSPSGAADITGTVLIRTTASDDVAVAKVSFFVNDRAVGSVSQAPWDLELDTAQFGSGDAELVAEATDSSGNVSRSAVVAVKLRNNLNKDVLGGCNVAGGFPLISLVLLALRRRRVARAIAKATSRAR